MKNLFVGNMSFQTTESDLRTLFEPYGEITRIHIVQDRDTGQARGFAFVEVADDAEAAKAISALNGKEVAGRALKVNEATPRPERGGSRGGGGFRDRGSRGGRF
jgi:cold-inducible RNA-binding protein